MNPLLHPIWWFRLSRAVGRRDHVKVLELAQSVLTKDSGNLVALTFAAKHSADLGRPADAIGFARRALAIDPDDVDLHCLVARHLDPAKDADEIGEHARWILAIAGTTLPGNSAEIEKWARKARDWAPGDRIKASIDRDIASRHEFNADAVAWAKAYLEFQKTLS